ncbi:GGDEF domain-containing protein [Actinoplanes sp. TRM 88003]|uniref:GGDEF domain-containing protein n=1 Tax=Paractinoplanes aksuensis TaxID=2939490 RepID=A0ABT1E206_9ACTN|nr:GGDEF domain-containing protein [Actinoplanes aksuensis]MCO8277035.1 GGDEF domain-containing protein [Actinoplanes aksuensis]
MGRGWKTYVAVMAVTVLAGSLLTDGSPAELTVSLGTGLSMAAAILIGLRRVPHGERAPWRFFALGLLLTALASLADGQGADVLPGDGPDLADALYLAFYPAIGIGLILMIKLSRRRTDWAALVDAATVTAGLALLAWIYAIGPALRDDTVGLAARLVTIAYPIADLLLLAITIRLLRSNGREGRRAPTLVAAAVLGYLAGDMAWVIVPHVNEAWADVAGVGQVINTVYELSVLVLTMAIAWPQVRGDGQGAASVSQLSRVQLAVLTAAVMISPALMIEQQLTGGITNGLAIAIGSAIMFLLVMARFTQLLKQAERQSRTVSALSRTDELTNLPNRRAWNDELPRVLERARSARAPVVVSMIDLDHFKSFNDTYGHPAGDRLLSAAAAAWSAELRDGDVLARYGGEEFIVLLPGTDESKATAVLERLRAVTPAAQTFSAGLARWDNTETSEALIARADSALYAAKAAGRDRILAAEAYAVS